MKYNLITIFHSVTHLCRVAAASIENRQIRLSLKQIEVATALSISMLLGSCKQNNDLIEFDTTQSYIYFALPNPTATAVEKFVDSVNYSFALDLPSPQEKRLAIPIKVIGNASPAERKYSYEIDPSQSYYEPSLVEISEPAIRGNAYEDSLYITLKNGAALKDTVMTLHLVMKENGNFKVGNIYNSKIKVKFTNKLLQPAWWTRWRTYLGDFTPEVFKLWIQIYYLGADPSPHLTNGTPGPVYFWDNMPFSPSLTSYPITHMYIEVLRKYLIEHPTYPNGDVTQPRIYLP